MVLTYHEILAGQSRYAYSVAYSLFREHLRFLGEVGTREQIPGLGVTFDDGHETHHAYGLPVLEENGLRGIFFVTVDWIEKRPSYMNWAQLAEIAALGHEVQSHGWSHRLLTSCSEEDLRRELSQSKDVLQQRLGKAVDAISMPGGRWNHRVAQACAVAGYKRIYTSDPWLEPVEKYGAIHIGRWMVRRTTGLPELRGMLDSQARPFHPLRLRHAFKQLVKTVAGDGLYQFAWELWSAKSAIRQIPADRAGRP